MTTRVHELWASAKEAISGGDWKRARLFMEELTHLLPQDAVMAYNRGLVYWKLDEYENAEEWLGRALQLKPDFPQATAALTYVRELTGLTDAPPSPEPPRTRVAVVAPPDDDGEEWLLGGGFWKRL